MISNARLRCGGVYPFFSETSASLSGAFIAYRYQKYRLVSFIKFNFSNSYPEIKLPELY